MRTYRILYYTEDNQKYSTFKDDCANPLAMANGFGTPVIILESFNNNGPLFNCLHHLSNFLEDYDGDLSSLIVIIDCVLAAKNPSKTLQALMIEYPEVKFLFDDDPKWVIFNKFDISDFLKKQSVDICFKCLEAIESGTEKGHATDKFIQSLSNEKSEQCNEESEQWKVLRVCILVDDSDNEGQSDIGDQIRKTRQELIRQIAHQSVKFDFLTLPEKDQYFILNLVHSKDNLFDVSIIRYAIKLWKYAELDVHRHNFRSIQNSRRDNLAISVEEEDQQNLINSYSLFANGFRVWPVTSASELMSVNDQTQKEEINPAIIVRDYDLQFYDSSCVDNKDPREAIKKIRGYRDSLDGEWTTHVQDSTCWSSFYTVFKENARERHQFASLPRKAFVSVCDRKDVKHPVYFVSKGKWNVKILPPGRFISRIGKKDSKEVIQMSHYYTDKKGDLCLPGLNKPISGIYTPFMCIPEIRQRFDSIKPDEKAYLDTNRECHSHGTSLAIYSLVVSLIQRAEKYYQNEKYIHAAILAIEAIEYLNGFHEVLLLKAYQVLALSENAIAMNTVGGEEELLREDTLLRIKKIEDELEWLLRRVPKKWKLFTYDERREFKYSLLIQIYSDCRLFCKEKEHFSSEDAFISAMAHVSDGFTSSDILHECIRITKKVLNSWKAHKAASISDTNE